MMTHELLFTVGGSLYSPLFLNFSTAKESNVSPWALLQSEMPICKPILSFPILELIIKTCRKLLSLDC
jgi:hypothetical protein